MIAGFERAGEVWVDSGTLMVSDPCYVDKGFDYDAWCEKGMGEKGILPEVADGTFTFSTTWGDGSWPVYVRRNEEGRITQVLIDTDPAFEEDE